MTTRDTFLAQAAERILITDGAFGTEIQNWKLSEADYAGTLGLSHDQKGNNDILALTKPEVPEAIHRAYFEAGADIAETNTFSANRISQADYGAEHLVREINVESAKLARRIADEFQAKDGRPRFVAGAIGPTCSFGAEQLRPHVKTLSDICDTLIMVYPNAGLPNELGAYDEAPATTAGLVGEWASAGQVNVLGGCCGSTPAHIKAIADMARGVAPRTVPTPPVRTRLAGLEPFTMAA